jgi:hypothetical protein
MALKYTGPEGKFYVKVTVGGNYQRTLEPIPGELYEIDDPGDGLWDSETVVADSGPVLADSGPVVADTPQSADNEPTEAVEGN